MTSVATPKVDYIFSVLLPNDTPKKQCDEKPLLFRYVAPPAYNLDSSHRKKIKKRSEAVHSGKATTQRREEGQMKSCVTNNVLPIPREIYFGEWL